MTNEAAVTQVLADYYIAFSTLDVQAILPYFHQPAFLIGPAGVFAVPSSAALTSIFAPAMEDLRARGYGRSNLSTTSQPAECHRGIGDRRRATVQTRRTGVRAGGRHLPAAQGRHWLEDRRGGAPRYRRSRATPIAGRAAIASWLPTIHARSAHFGLVAVSLRVQQTAADSHPDP